MHYMQNIFLKLPDGITIKLISYCLLVLVVLRIQKYGSQSNTNGDLNFHSTCRLKYDWLWFGGHIIAILGGAVGPGNSWHIFGPVGVAVMKTTRWMIQQCASLGIKSTESINGKMQEQWEQTNPKSSGRIGLGFLGTPDPSLEQTA